MTKPQKIINLLCSAALFHFASSCSLRCTNAKFYSRKPSSQPSAFSSKEKLSYIKLPKPECRQMKMVETVKQLASKRLRKRSQLKLSKKKKKKSKSLWWTTMLQVIYVAAKNLQTAKTMNHGLFTHVQLAQIAEFCHSERTNSWVMTKNVFIWPQWPWPLTAWWLQCIQFILKSVIFCAKFKEFFSFFPPRVVVWGIIKEEWDWWNGQRLENEPSFIMWNTAWMLMWFCVLLVLKQAM